MKANKNIVWILIVVVVGAGVAYALFNLDHLRRQIVSLETTTVADRVSNKLSPPKVDQVVGNLVSTNLSPSVGDSIAVELTLIGIERMNAAEITLSVDPRTFTIVDVNPGSIWSQPNVLIKDIDLETGLISLSIGNGLGSQLNPSGTVIVLNLKVVSGVVNNTEPKISLLPQSGVVLSNEETLRPLAVEALTFNINNN